MGNAHHYVSYIIITDSLLLLDLDI